MRKIIRYDLDFWKTEPYFKDHIDGGNTLSKLLLEINNFEEGNFYTFMTEDANINQLYKFELGGILPEFPEEEIYIKSLNRTFVGERINSIDNELANFIFNFLKSKKHFSYICDDVNSSSTDSIDTELFKSSGYVFRKDIYYLLGESTVSRRKLIESLQVSNAIWHSLSILTEIDFNDIIDRKLTLTNLQKICQNAKLIVTGAYDREGYIFWEKNI